MLAPAQVSELNDAAFGVLKSWIEMAAVGDWSRVTALLTPDAVFHSPVGLKPYPGRELVSLVLTTAARVFQQFEYESFAIGDRMALLRFHARVEDAEAHGVHVLRFATSGDICDVEKMIRPARVAIALGNAIGDLAGEQIRMLRDGR